MNFTTSQSIQADEDAKGPKVSVIIPTYNRPMRLREAILSVVNQTFTGWELIVVDDCSTMGVEDPLGKFAEDDRIKFLSLDKNHGSPCYARNFGIEQAAGEFIAFLDDDDRYHPNALAELLVGIESTEFGGFDVAYGKYDIFTELTNGISEGWAPTHFDPDLLLKKNYIVTCSTLIRKAELLRIGGFDENVPRFNDWHLFLRLQQNSCAFTFVPSVLSIVALHDDTLTKKHDVYTDSKGNIIPHPYFDINNIQTVATKSYLIAEIPVDETRKFVSIIVPVIYRADLARVCIDSIINYTDFPYELILVQEGDDEEITNLLKSYDAKFVQNKQPLGFAGAMNSGIRLSEGTHYCFLNSDVVVIPDWLNYMMKAFDDITVGLVTPTYSEMPGRQDIGHNLGNELEYVIDPLSLKGVCFLVSKEAIDAVGQWDESFGLGGGDDNDMCIRVAKGDFKLAIARKSFIYHYGSASFRREFNDDVAFSKKYAVGQFNKVRKKHSLNDKPRVFIGIPDQDARVCDQLSLRLVEWSHDQEIHLGIRYFPHLTPLDHARNTIVKNCLEEYWDFILQIDGDIVPPPNALRELLKADRDIIAPVCLTFKPDDNGFMCPIPIAMRYDEDGNYRPYYGTGIEETDTVTGGMFLVKREVYEKIERPFAFTYHKDGTVIYSEDFYFSQKCQEAGYKLYTHYNLICEHYKTVGAKNINDLILSITKGEQVVAKTG